ncbi:hypothetical protein MOO46_07435 (plasmid) [Apilactobacillus apisilvae]|uniref:Uncharacterized protein n=1 Tax=Apilactobacillus apisilvae TaxID=2923364 RepID=A0ABY4PKH1_9LACO|nr:hypothetical protein [Apilactobacillus apisilvae]UQS85816.1 hypothetical protein MOO46_07435 [Apilactobacillus apisilvae]
MKTSIEDFMYRKIKCRIKWIDMNNPKISEDMSHYCGYILLPLDSDFMQKYGYYNVIDTISEAMPIEAPGGITWNKFNEDEQLQEIGFDTAHFNDWENGISTLSNYKWNKDKIIKAIKHMADQVLDNKIAPKKFKIVVGYHFQRKEELFYFYGHGADTFVVDTPKSNNDKLFTNELSERNITSLLNSLKHLDNQEPFRIVESQVKSQLGYDY